MERIKKIDLKQWSVIIFISVTLVLCILYACNFGIKLSSKNQDWGSFSDFIGGIITPILTLINIIVFINLTKAISKDDEKRSNEQISHQTKILISNMRYDKLKEFNQMNINVRNSKDKFEYKRKLGELNAFLVDLKMSHLFKGTENSSLIDERIHTCIEELITMLSQNSIDENKYNEKSKSFIAFTYQTSSVMEMFILAQLKRDEDICFKNIGDFLNKVVAKKK